MTHIIHKYRSRKNEAFLIETENGTFVLKEFTSRERYERELCIYDKLRGSDIPSAEVVKSEPLTLVLTVLPGNDMVSVLEEQEGTGVIDHEVWDRLIDWLLSFNRQTGFVMIDLNLRNFIYDEDGKTVYGMDFEECEEGEVMLMAARLAAYIRTYHPENSRIKREISDHVLNRFSSESSLDISMLKEISVKEEHALMDFRRKNGRLGERHDR